MASFSNISYEIFRSEAIKLMDNAQDLNRDQAKSAYKALVLLYAGRSEDWMEFERENAEYTISAAHDACFPTNPVKRMVEEFESVMSDIVSGRRI